jgi:hypothetical protein
MHRDNTIVSKAKLLGGKKDRIQFIKWLNANLRIFLFQSAASGNIIRPPETIFYSGKFPFFLSFVMLRTKNL